MFYILNTRWQLSSTQKHSIHPMSLPDKAIIEQVNDIDVIYI